MDRQYQQPKCAHHIQLGILSSCERNWYNYYTVFQKSNTFPGVYSTIQTNLWEMISILDTEIIVLPEFNTLCRKLGVTDRMFEIMQ